MLPPNSQKEMKADGDSFPSSFRIWGGWLLTARKVLMSKHTFDNYKLITIQSMHVYELNLLY